MDELTAVVHTRGGLVESVRAVRGIMAEDEMLIYVEACELADAGDGVLFAPIHLFADVGDVPGGAGLARFLLAPDGTWQRS